MLLGAGVLIGYGAKLAGGCTSGNGLSGNAILSPASLVATGTFFGTAIAVSFLIEALIMSARRRRSWSARCSGSTLSWSGMTSPDVLRDGLLFRDAYLMLFFASALATAFVGMRRAARCCRPAALLDAASRWRGRPCARSARHVAGSVLFGIGWAVADACPGPIAAQLGQGVAWSLATTAGVVLGIWVFLRRQPRAA